MNKTELLSTYTAEQLADMVVGLQDALRLKIGKCEVSEDEGGVKAKCDNCGEEFIALLDNEHVLCTKAELFATREANKQLNRDVTKLQYEVCKHRKSFEDAEKERDCKIAKYQKKIEELEKRDISDFLPTEPIKIADTLISATYTRKKGNMKMAIHKAFGNNADTAVESVYSVSELRQIAEHLLVYCNANGEDGHEEP